jgi:hypothetical protein
MAWYDAVVAAMSEGEEIIGIAHEKNKYSTPGPMSTLDNSRSMGSIRTMYMLIRAKSMTNASVYSRDYITRYLWEVQFPGVTFVKADMWKMQFAISDLQVVDLPDGKGYLKECSCLVVDYASLLNNPNYVGYIGMTTRINTITTSNDKSGRPIILQYQYPVTHPRRPAEIVTSVGSFQKSYPIITLRLPMVKYMRYPLACASLINLCNSDTFLGFTTRKCRIDNVGYKAIYTPGGRTGDNLYKHIYLIECDVSMSDMTYDSIQEILDDNNRPPVDRGVWGALQPGLTYPGIDVAVTNYTCAFNTLWPQFGSVTLSDMFTAEFAGLTIS